MQPSRVLIIEDEPILLDTLSSTLRLKLPRTHIDTADTCVIHDPVWDRRIVIEKSGSLSTVVWNPWVEKTAALADMESRVNELLANI